MSPAVMPLRDAMAQLFGAPGTWWTCPSQSAAVIPAYEFVLDLKQSFPGMSSFTTCPPAPGRQAAVLPFIEDIVQATEREPVGSLVSSLLVVTPDLGFKMSISGCLNLETGGVFAKKAHNCTERREPDV